jgi:hypothetical protein
MTERDGYFLSTRNPLATVDQREVEEIALRLLQRAEMRRGRELVTLLWRNVMAYPAADQMDRFDNMIDEYMFHFALRAANSDGRRPRISRMMAPAARCFGRDVPGSRWGGDSPDFIYRVIPIAHGCRYEITGRRSCPDPITATFTLVGDSVVPAALGILDSLDMAVDGDGGFTITVDGEPADGRPNHIRTQPGADHLMIRDALGDWLAQGPSALQVRRLDSGQHERSPTEEEMARKAARAALDCVYYTYYTMQSANGQPPNELRPPMSSGAFGGMPTQMGTKSNLVLAGDEAMIVTTNAAGAQFRNAVLCDLFYMSLNYWSRLGSLNMAQMARDEDGRFTFVIAHEDPGVHNWLDTGGLKRMIFGHRWQAFNRQDTFEAPAISGRVVKFADLQKELPAGILRTDARDRARQIAERKEGFARRFADI